MAIVIVDDSTVSLGIIADMLGEAGYDDLILAESVDDAFNRMGVAGDEACAPVIDLVLMDIHMPGKDGLQGSRELKAMPRFEDVPVIIITGSTPQVTLEAAFEAGAMDFISKPPVRIELLTRVRSALHLKAEMDKRKQHEAELLELNCKLEEMNRELQLLSSRDALTGIANRRCFDEFMMREWARAYRNPAPVSVIMIDLDYFKGYNDTYGHLAGDECLSKVAEILGTVLKRQTDILARYGGEEFIAILPGTELSGAAKLAEEMRTVVAGLAIPHKSSAVSRHVTISLGIACMVPDKQNAAKLLIEAADRGLYQAKQHGRNRIGIMNSTTIDGQPSGKHVPVQVLQAATDQDSLTLVPSCN
jgi:diguanylate cyclase (GGDEF)-like protein